MVDISWVVRVTLRLAPAVGLKSSCMKELALFVPQSKAMGQVAGPIQRTLLSRALCFK